MNTRRRDLTLEVQSCIKQLEQLMETSLQGNYEEEIPQMPVATTRSTGTAQLHHLNIPAKTAAMQEHATPSRQGTYEQEMHAMPASTTRSTVTAPHPYVNEPDQGNALKEQFKEAYLKEIYEDERDALPASTQPSNAASSVRELKIPGKAGALQDAIFKSANCAIIATDASGMIQIFNSGAEQMLGYSAEDVINKITPADLANSQEMLARARTISDESGITVAPGFKTLVHKAAKGIEDIYELAYIKKDGSRIPVVMTVTALRDDDQDIIGYLLIGTDNTKREEERNRLLLSDAALKAIGEGVVITDSNGHTIYANNAYLSMTGYGIDELLGKNLSLLQGRLTDTNDINAVRKSIDNGSIYSGEILNYKKDGSIFWNHMTISPIENDNKTKINYIGITQDITIRRKNDEENKSYAYIDPLTELPNRRLLHDRMQQAIAGNRRSGDNSALIVLDIDNFKILNDGYGHGAGDSCLIEAARRLKKITRENDTVARIGGDEFIILLNNLDNDKEIAKEEATKVAEKIKEILSVKFIIENKKEGERIVTEHTCSASLGLVVFNSPEISLNKIINCADTAMYKSKKTGKNSITLMEFDELNPMQKKYA